MQLDNPIDKINKIYRIIIPSFKILIITAFSLFMIIYLYYLVVWVYFGDESTTVQPFEITGMTTVSGTTVADLFSFELNHALEINCMQLENAIENRPRTDAMGTKDIAPIVSRVYSDADVSSRNPSTEKKIAEVGSVGVGGSSLSVGQLILSFKELARKNPSTITGSLQRYGSTISMVAIWNDRKSQRKVVREARLSLAKNNYSVEDQIPTLVSDLAFQIAIEMLKQQHLLKEAYPQTWQGFELLTQARNDYLNYTMAGNLSDLDKARDTAVRIRQLEPGYIGDVELELLSYIASVYLKVGRPTEAEYLYKNVSHLKPFESNLFLGKIYEKENRKEDALNAYEKAIEQNPGSYEAWNTKGLALTAQGKYDNAIKAYNKAIEINNQTANDWNDKGLALDDLGVYDDAIKAYDKAIEINHQTANAWNNKGAALTAQGKYDDAIKAIDKAIELDPQLATAWSNKGLALSAQGKFDDAIKAYDICQLLSIQKLKIIEISSQAESA